MFSNRVQNLHIAVLMIVVVYTIIVQGILIPQLSQQWRSVGYVFVVFSSFGFYKVILIALISFINRNRTMLFFYWGDLFIDGIWAYTYELDGKKRIGIWQIDQDLYGIKFFGFGLNDDFSIRSKVRSISQLLDSAGAFEIITIRRDLQDPMNEYFTRTIMWVDNGKRRTFRPKPAITIRATSTIYGGQLSGISHPNVVATKINSALTVSDAIELLKSGSLIL